MADKNDILINVDITKVHDAIRQFDVLRRAIDLMAQEATKLGSTPKFDKILSELKFLNSEAERYQKILSSANLSDKSVKGFDRGRYVSTGNFIDELTKKTETLRVSISNLSNEAAGEHNRIIKGDDNSPGWTKKEIVKAKYMTPAQKIVTSEMQDKAIQTNKEIDFAKKLEEAKRKEIEISNKKYNDQQDKIKNSIVSQGELLKTNATEQIKLTQKSAELERKERIKTTDAERRANDESFNERVKGIYERVKIQNKVDRKLHNDNISASDDEFNRKVSGIAKRLELERKENAKLINTPQSIADERIEAVSTRYKQALADRIALTKKLSDTTKLSGSEISSFKTQLQEANEVINKGSFHLGTFFSRFKDGIGRLVEFQLHWYATKLIIFSTVQMMGSAIMTQLELGKAVKQAGAAADMTAKQMEDLRKQSIAISNEVPMAANVIAKSAFTFAQSGMTFDTIKIAMPLAAKMVVATGEDMKVAVDALTTAFFAWKLQAKDLPATADMISAAMAASKMEVKDLGTVFNYLATTAKVLNTNLDSLTSIKDTLVLSATLSQAGVKPSTIGTGLSNAVTQLVKASKDANSRLGKILSGDGIDLSKVDPTKNRLTDVFKELSRSKELTLADVFKGWELRGGRSVSAILNQAEKTINEMEQRISEKGVLEKMFKTSTNNVLDQLKILQNKFNNIFQITGKQEEGFVSIIKFGQMILELISKIRNELLVVLGLWAGISIFNHLTSSVTMLSGTFGKLIEKIYKAIGATEGLKLAISTIGKTVLTIGIVFGITYVLKGIADKTMADENAKLGDLLKTFTNDEIATLKKMSSSKPSEWTKLKGTGLGFAQNEKDMVNKLERAGLGRISQDNIKKLLIENDKPVVEETKPEKDTDRSGNGDDKKDKAIKGASSGISAENKDFQTELNKIKTNLERQLNINENFRKLGIRSESQYYIAADKLQEDAYNEELILLEKHVTRLKVQYNNRHAGKKGIALTNDQKQEQEAIEAAEQQVAALKAKYDNESNNRNTDGILRVRKAEEERNQGSIERTKVTLEAQQELRKKDMEAELAEREELYSKGKISAKEYYDYLDERAKESYDLVIEKLNGEEAAIIDTFANDTRNMQFDDPEYIKKFADLEKKLQGTSTAKGIASKDFNANVKKNSTDMKKQFGSAYDGIVAAQEEWFASSKTAMQTAKDITTAYGNGIKSSVTMMFEDMRTGTFDFEKYFLNFLTKLSDAFNDAVSSMVANWFMGQEAMKGEGSKSGGGWLGTSLKFVIGAIAGSSGGLSAEQNAAINRNYDGAQVTHTGGTIKMFHNGGLNSDERMVINKVGERYITQEQNAWLNNIAGTMSGGKESNQATSVNYYINAVDPKSFVDLLNKNPNAITSIVGKNMQGNGSLRKINKATR